MATTRPRPRPSEGPAGRVRRSGRNGRRSARQAGAARQSGAFRQRASRRCRSRSATTHRAFDLDGPLPEIPESNASKSGRERDDRARAAREADGAATGAARRRLWRTRVMVGTPATIADQMEEWLVTEACDGFNVMFPYLSRRARRLRRSRGAGVAAARAFPARVRRAKPCGRISAFPAPQISSFLRARETLHKSDLSS